MKDYTKKKEFVNIRKIYHNLIKKIKIELYFIK
jgi:hypothetical protein